MELMPTRRMLWAARKVQPKEGLSFPCPFQYSVINSLPTFGGLPEPVCKKLVLRLLLRSHLAHMRSPPSTLASGSAAEK
eukprot:2067682-Amphidinium_carterae.1